MALQDGALHGCLLWDSALQDSNYCAQSWSNPVFSALSTPLSSLRTPSALFASPLPPLLATSPRLRLLLPAISSSPCILPLLPLAGARDRLNSGGLMASRSLLSAEAAAAAEAVEESDEEEFFDAPSSFPPVDEFVMPQVYARVRDPFEADKVPDSDLSLIRLAKEVLGSVKAGADVTNVNLPASVLDPVSTLEKATKSMQRGDLLPDIVAGSDAVERMMAVIRFSFSGLAKEKFGKKPYNPVLGEVFRCSFLHRNPAHGATVLVAEQVSHHPPITALHLTNASLGFHLNSYTAPEPRFWGNSLEVKLKGCIRITLDRHGGEEYRLTRPVLHMSGFFAGRQRLEFAGPAEIVCEKTGLAAELDYKSRGMLARSEPHAVSGRIYDTRTKESLYLLEGFWDNVINITDVRTNSTSIFFDSKDITASKTMIPILPMESELEESFSTRVWAECSEAIWRGHSADANAAKRKVEDAQRAAKKARAEKGEQWRYHYFRKRTDGMEGYVLHEGFTGKLKPTLIFPKHVLDAIREARFADVDPSMREVSRISDGTKAAASAGSSGSSPSMAPEKPKPRRRLAALGKGRFAGNALNGK